MNLIKLINVPDMTMSYVGRRGRARHQVDNVTMEHHYRVDIFNAVVDVQPQELNKRFDENVSELLTLSCALDPRKGCKNFQVDDICKRVLEFYPEDFTYVEKEMPRVQLHHFEFEIINRTEVAKSFNISELCRWMVDKKSWIFIHLFIG